MTKQNQQTKQAMQGFRYLIYQNPKGTWDCKFYINDQMFAGPRGVKSYLELLRLVQLLQLPLSEFDAESVRVADELKIDDAA